MFSMTRCRAAYDLHVKQLKATYAEREKGRADMVRELFDGPVVGQTQSTDGTLAADDIVETGSNGDLPPPVIVNKRNNLSFANITQVSSGV